MTDSDRPMTDSDRITRLDDEAVRKIAAGEVVERPASVVKELVENSLDADADRVDVTVVDGGTERIVVSDDGVGMTEPDVRAAVREHTTSKLEGADDLESGVTTLGFRGEALHTIGAVSRLTITTKPRADAGSDRSDGGSGRATELRMAGGEVESVAPAGRPAGTTVEVRDLFYNTPARRKYLGTTATEFSHVNSVVTRYALANPDVAVSLTHDDREVFATPGRGDLEAALLAVYGREVATSMIRVEGGTATEGGSDAADGTARDDARADDTDVTVSGYVSDPETTRSSREYLSTFVNGRYVRSPVVRDAVLSAYGDQLAAERYPFAVVFVEVPPESVDVNVHPRKLECRWDDEDAVRDAVESAVSSALLDHGLVRSSAPRGASAPDEAAVAPERADAPDDAGNEGTKLARSESREQVTLDASTDARSSPAGDNRASAGSSRTEREGPDADGRAAADAPGADASAPTDGSAGADATANTDAEGGGDAGPDAEGDADAGARPGGRGEPDASASERDRDATEHGHGSTTADASASRDADAPASRSAGERTGAARKFDPATEAATLAGEPTETPEFDSLPRMRLLGQLRDTYLVAETPDGLVLVDQHAADERVNYERLREAFDDDATAQMLARPVDLELTAGEAAAFDAYRDALERLGFRAERKEGDAGERPASDAERTEDDAGDRAGGDSPSRTVTVRTAPTVLDETLDPERLRDALAGFVATDPDDRGDTVEAVADDLLADLACYPSITGNTSLREGSAVELLAALDDCENPYACPHGRPVLVEFDAEEIEERFERDYPGHAGRRDT